MFFEDFACDRVDVGEAVLRVRHGGSGPPVVLLHGHPRTHTTWHRVARRLIEASHGRLPRSARLREVAQATDDPDHAPYSKRAMAGDVVTMMRDLGHDAFRGGRARPRHVRRAAAGARSPGGGRRIWPRWTVCPIVEALERCDARFAQAWFHWFFFAQPPPRRAHHLRGPDWWYARRTAAQMGAEAYADCMRAIHDPATVHAMVEDYRAGAVDRPGP